MRCSSRIDCNNLVEILLSTIKEGDAQGSRDPHLAPDQAGRWVRDQAGAEGEPLQRGPPVRVGQGVVVQSRPEKLVPKVVVSTHSNSPQRAVVHLPADVLVVVAGAAVVTAHGTPDSVSTRNWPTVRDR